MDNSKQKEVKFDKPLKENNYGHLSTCRFNILAKLINISAQIT